MLRAAVKQWGGEPKTRTHEEKNQLAEPQQNVLNQAGRARPALADTSHSKTRMFKDWTGRHGLDSQLFSQGQLSNRRQIRTLTTALQFQNSLVKAFLLVHC